MPPNDKTTQKLNGSMLYSYNKKFETYIVTIYKQVLLGSMSNSMLVYSKSSRLPPTKVILVSLIGTQIPQSSTIKPIPDSCCSMQHIDLVFNLPKVVKLNTATTIKLHPKKSTVKVALPMQTQYTCRLGVAMVYTL